MAQAQTLTEVQLRRCLKWCKMRRHSTRDTTIFYVSYYAGLRAKEIAALTVGNVYDETGTVREQFVLAASQTKGSKTRTVWINVKLRRQLEHYRKQLQSKHPNDALFQSQKGGAFSANTMTQLFLNIYRAAGFEKSYCQIWCLRVLGHAAIWPWFVASIPSLNVTPVMTLAR